MSRIEDLPALRGPWDTADDTPSKIAEPMACEQPGSAAAGYTTTLVDNVV